MSDTSSFESRMAYGGEVQGPTCEVKRSFAILLALARRQDRAEPVAFLLASTPVENLTNVRL